MFSRLKHYLRWILTKIAKKLVRYVEPGVVLNEVLLTCDYPKMKNTYGDFHFDRDYSQQHINGLSKESGNIRGVIVHNVQQTRSGCKRVLLPGEYNKDKPYYASLFRLSQDCFVTAGIGDDMDYQWDYELDPPIPNGETFDYIISQAMLEHLMNPYKHVADLANLLNPGGHLILHTHPPGFNYHRYPIDCMRFYPDWFEEIANRLGLRVLDRYIGELRICYTYIKCINQSSPET